MYDEYQKGLLAREEQEKLLKKLSENTAIQAVEIKTKEAENLALTASKFGGVPYWNFAEKTYPCDREGNKLVLLAQINCLELPKNPDLPEFPEIGLLQFFIALNDSMGLDYDNPISQKDFRIIYWEKVDENISIDNILAQDIPTTLTMTDDEFFPIYDGTEYALNFDLQTTSLGEHSFEFESEVKKAAKELDIVIPDDGECSALFDEEEESSKIKGLKSNAGHWIGGYPFFTQTDPRTWGDFDNYGILLLQIDSDDDIMWGDCGVGNFFITREDLKNRDFSKVLYNWDCY